MSMQTSAEKKKRNFTLHFAKSLGVSGTFVPSSKFLVKKMLSKIDFTKVKTILELGPGEGCITREILKLMSADAKLITFEINKLFCEHLEKIDDKRLKVVNGSASEMKEELLENNIQFPDVIISAIPFGILSEKICSSIMAEIKNCTGPDTQLVQFSYSIVQKRRFKNIYSKISVDFEIRNFPPAFVFSCTN